MCTFGGLGIKNKFPRILGLFDWVKVNQKLLKSLETYFNWMPLLKNIAVRFWFCQSWPQLKYYKRAKRWSLGIYQVACVLISSPRRGVDTEVPLPSNLAPFPSGSLTDGVHRNAAGRSGISLETPAYPGPRAVYRLEIYSRRSRITARVSRKRVHAGRWS